MDIQTKREIRRDPFKVRVLELDGISPQITLSRVVHQFIAEFSQINGIARVCDYENRLQDNRVFIYTCDGNDYLKLLALESVVIDGQIGRFYAPHVAAVNAKFSMPSSSYPVHLMRQCPPTAGIFNLPVSLSTPINVLLATLEAFERANTVTGFIIPYDIKRKRPRNFGFMMYLSRTQMLERLGDRELIRGKEIQVKPATAAPVILHTTIANELIQDGPINNAFEWNEMIMNHNWLKAVLIRHPIEIRHHQPQVEQPSVAPRHRHPRIEPPTSSPQNSCSKSSMPPARCSKEVEQPLVSSVSAPAMQVDLQDAATLPLMRFDSLQETPMVLPKFSEIPRAVSPVLSIGDDYDLTEEGELSVPGTQMKMNQAETSSKKDEIPGIPPPKKRSRLN